MLPPPPQHYKISSAFSYNFISALTPIAELTAGTLELTKAPDCGGVICEQSTKEQFLYEVLDPANYITPDVVVDVSGAAIRQQGENRVRVEGIRGRRRPDTLKLCVGYHKGWKTVSMLSFTWPDAYEKARYCAEVIMKKMARIGGVFYSSDELAMGGLRYFYEAGVPIPGQVKLIALGYNSLKNTELSIPALSVIDIPIERAAERCLTILTRLMRYEKADPSESESIISEYIPRESCPGV